MWQIVANPWKKIMVSYGFFWWESNPLKWWVFHIYASLQEGTKSCQTMMNLHFLDPLSPNKQDRKCPQDFGGYRSGPVVNLLRTAPTCLLGITLFGVIYSDPQTVGNLDSFNIGFTALICMQLYAYVYMYRGRTSWTLWCKSCKLSAASTPSSPWKSPMALQPKLTLLRSMKTLQGMGIPGS